VACANSSSPRSSKTYTFMSPSKAPPGTIQYKLLTFTLTTLAVFPPISTFIRERSFPKLSPYRIKLLPDPPSVGKKRSTTIGFEGSKSTTESSSLLSLHCTKQSIIMASHIPWKGFHILLIFSTFIYVLYWLKIFFYIQDLLVCYPFQVSSFVFIN